jgi:hypothetical protein
MTPTDHRRHSRSLADERKRRHRAPIPSILAWVWAGFVLALAPPVAADQTVDTERSVFALLTHKGGFAQGRAHDHVIVAAEPTAELSWSGAPAGASFRLSARAADLEVDPPETRDALAGRFEELGLRSGDFQPIDAEQRAKVRETMLGRKQLDAERFPAIGARLLELREEPSTVGAVAMTHRGVVELEAHGETVEVPFAGRVDQEGDTLRIEATGRLRFTDLGIEPYSAFLGAVKNLDEIDLYLLLHARTNTSPSRPPP